MKELILEEFFDENGVRMGMRYVEKEVEEQEPERAECEF